ncbi:hypothetical protein DOY81_005146, partial [Sarcophaga bullata]
STMWSRTVVTLFLVTLMLTGVLTEELELPPYIKFTVDGKTYIMYFNKLNWFAALEYCRRENKILGSILSMEVNQMLVNSLKPYGLHNNRDAVWVGGYDIDHEGEFVWLSTGRTMENFSNWEETEPNNLKGGEDCMEMKAITGQWNDHYCTMEKHFVCEDLPT